MARIIIDTFARQISHLINLQNPKNSHEYDINCEKVPSCGTNIVAHDLTPRNIRGVRAVPSSIFVAHEHLEKYCVAPCAMLIEHTKTADLG